ncbi:MAG: NAD(P)-binding protein, partial [Terriglobales bacterium]
MVQLRPHVAIVGGGIGGLFAANALVANGLRVSVYEQAPALGEVGAGVY